jgi:hypothetical protein
LCHKNRNQFRLYSISVIETWLLNDNTALTTASEIMNEGYLLDITISEVGGCHCARIPAHIDSKRFVELEIIIALLC